MRNLTFLLFMIIGVLFISCEKQIADVQDADAVPSEVLQKLESFYLNTSDVEFKSFENPDKSIDEGYMVEGCMLIGKEQLASLSVHDGIEGEQYRTNNLVSSPRVIRVLGYTGGVNALTLKMRTGLQWAVNNYNALPLGLTFTLSYGTNTVGKDIVVYRVPSSSAGGSAGFPSGGKPYKWVRILGGLNSYSYNVNEHVITHEIGHCVGLRHTDWFSRASCGGISPEPAAPYGAIHIPGTPWGYDANSLMLACFNSSENGEFGPEDKDALNFLY